MNIPIIGVVENMTVFIPPDLPDRSYQLFGSGGGLQLASENELPLLAKIPMEMTLQEGGNEGEPIVNSSPSSKSAEAFTSLARKIVDYASLGAEKK